VTVVDSEGRRHSLDLRAGSLYDAAHIYFCHTKEHPEKGLPRMDLATAFEVVIEGKVYRVEGKALQSAVDRDAASIAQRAEGVSIFSAPDAGIAAKHRLCDCRTNCGRGD
jgi:hypothetical protein